jgi:hypothetical protein
MSNTKELNISSSAWLTYGVGVFPFGFVLFLIATPVIRFSPQVRAATDDLDGQGAAASATASELIRGAFSQAA